MQDMVENVWLKPPMKVGGWLIFRWGIYRKEPTQHMSKPSNRKSENIKEKYFRIPNLKYIQPLSVPAENATVAKLRGPNAAFIDDILGNLSNCYTVVKQTRIFYAIENQEFYCYIHLLPKSGAVQQ